MRFLVKTAWPVETSNDLAREGKLGSTVRSILAELKPEAAYFVTDHGERSVYLIVDMDDASQMPAIAEPWFLAFDASVEFHPVMLAEDLAKAGPAIERAVDTYG